MLKVGMPKCAGGAGRHGCVDNRSIPALTSRQGGLSGCDHVPHSRLVCWRTAAAHACLATLRSLWMAP